jgi:hypothetical protein
VVVAPPFPARFGSALFYRAARLGSAQQRFLSVLPPADASFVLIVHKMGFHKDN